MDYTVNLKGHTLEYFDEDHLYVVDGIIVPSITQILKLKFSKKYDGVNPDVLQKAADEGTRVHEAIQKCCETGEGIDLTEVRNFLFLKKQYKFEVMQNEVPVILFKDEEPVAAGRLDMVIRMNDELGIADIKRTSALDKEYLAYQLNLYRIAFQQLYGKEIKFLRGIHVRNDTRKFVPIPINEDLVNELVNQYLEKEKP